MKVREVMDVMDVRFRDFARRHLSACANSTTNLTTITYITIITSITFRQNALIPVSARPTVS